MVFHVLNRGVASTGINGQAQKLANPEKMASQPSVWWKVGKSPRLDAMA
jgi:hypothetical protein